jgi:1-acyl-sn-glycerol-3-phosphate acyltransferase
MKAEAWLNHHPVARLIWKPSYELVYQCLKVAAMLIFGPAWRVRRVGRRAHAPRGGVLLCPNHASYLDPAFVQMCVRRRLVFVMTENFYQLRRWRWFFRLVSAVSIGRGRKARKGLRRAMALVRRGHALVVFPEGRLTEDGSLSRGQRGVGRLARLLDVPVIPVGIAGARNAWGKGQARPGKARVRVAFGRPVRWHDAVPGDERASEQAFVDRVMVAIAHTKAWVETHAPDSGDVRPVGPALQEPQASGR